MVWQPQYYPREITLSSTILEGGFIFGGKAGFADLQGSLGRSEKETTQKQQHPMHGSRSYLLFFFESNERPRGHKVITLDYKIPWNF